MIKKITYTATALLASMLWAMPAVALGELKTLSEARQAEIQKKIEAIEARSEEKIKELQSKTEKKTVEVRKKACEARQSNIQNRLSDRVSAAERHKEKFDSIYSRVKDFATTKSISSNDITTLASAVDTSSVKVIEEIAALDDMNIVLDCTKPDDVATTLNSYKTQLENVKTSLKEYREAIRIYAQAVKSQAETTEGDQQ